ncbi:triphosphoribosyl-dephospho-CoA synthase [Candidatus Bathyarchaeota archaeon]|nr:triphosphoribosyl-dephospho-CoA synthase [Candidatus Bathyarchaeota archaeon]
MKPRRNLPDYVMKCAQLAASLEVSGYPKPGNVHRTADFHDLHFEDFLSSSIAIGSTMRRLAQRGLAVSRGRLRLDCISIGENVKEALDEILNWQKGGNTHLGTILLFSPLAAAAGLCGSTDAITPKNLRHNIGEVVGATTWKDATFAFETVSKITPQTLGRLPDSNAPDLSLNKRMFAPRITLLEAMRYSSSWDGVASEWSTSFEKIFTVGYPKLVEVFAETRDVNTSTVHAFMFLLSCFSDTFIARKAGLKYTPYIDDAVRIGSVETQWVSRSASEALKLGGLTTLEGKAEILKLDDHLRKEALNPGTTADLVGACLMVALLCGWVF